MPGKEIRQGGGGKEGERLTLPALPLGLHTPSPGWVGGCWGGGGVGVPGGVSHKGAGGEGMGPLSPSQCVPLRCAPTCSPTGGHTDMGTYRRMGQCHGEAAPPHTHTHIHHVLSPGHRGDPPVPSACPAVTLLSHPEAGRMLLAPGALQDPQAGMSHRVTAGHGDSGHRGCPRGGTTSSCPQCPEHGPCTSIGLSTMHWCPVPEPSSKYWVPVPSIGSHCHVFGPTATYLVPLPRIGSQYCPSTRC